MLCSSDFTKVSKIFIYYIVIAFTLESFQFHRPEKNTINLIIMTYCVEPKFDNRCIIEFIDLCSNWKALLFFLSILFIPFSRACICICILEDQSCQISSIHSSKNRSFPQRQPQPTVNYAGIPLGNRHFKNVYK